jgi:ubiquitin C-terminal hydrolase
VRDDSKRLLLTLLIDEVYFVEDDEDPHLPIEELATSISSPNYGIYDLLGEIPPVHNLIHGVSKEYIWNGATKTNREKCRAMYRIGSPKFLDALVEELKISLAPLKTHLAPNGFSVITSDQNTTVQDVHLDYPSLVGTIYLPLYLPLVVIVALEDGVSVIIDGKIVPISKGKYLVMKGNTPHRGAGWIDCKGARLHFYIDTREHQASSAINTGYLNQKMYDQFQWVVPVINPTFRAECSGITNIGNTCFFNSIIQLLRYTPTFVDQLRRTMQQIPEDSLISLIGNLVMKKNQRSLMKDINLILADDYLVGRQYDATEAMRRVLAVLQARCNDHYGTPRLIPNVYLADEEFISPYHFVTQATAECLGCSSKSSVKCVNQDIAIGLPNSSASSLTELLKADLEGDTGASSDWICPQECQTPRTNHSVVLISLPLLLNLSMKRFLVDPSSQQMRKNYLEIDFEDILDMAPWCDVPLSCPTRYYLYGIICHTGTLTEGHYYCYVRNIFTSPWGAWQRYDDDKVETQKNVTKKMRKNGYLLMYRQETLKEFQEQRSQPRRSQRK